MKTLDERKEGQEIRRTAKRDAQAAVLRKEQGGSRRRHGNGRVTPPKCDRCGSRFGVGLCNARWTCGRCISTPFGGAS